MSAEDDGFNSKNWVWVPDNESVFTKGYITDYLSDGKCKVTVVNGNKELQEIVDGKSLESCNPAKFNKCDDMAELTHLNEPSVVYNLYLRYNDDLIYTYSGLFLVAINPYKSLPIYGKKVLKRFHSHDYDKPPPHIYATAEGTYRNLLENGKDQSILVTGESGAGKTENTKKIIQYLSSITTGDSENENLDENHSIDSRILEANPILESFGNARTIKNNNSSRFGKFIKIFFSAKGTINGANIDYYLLEKSRVTSPSDLERNYHVFYQFLKGCDEDTLSKYNLKRQISNYKYLMTSAIEIPQVDDSKEFHHLVHAFDIMGFSNEETNNIFSILAVILHLGNLTFKSYKAEQASFQSEVELEYISNILGVNKDNFLNNLLRPKVKAGREYVQKSKRATEVKFTIDALSRHFYELTFQYIIDRINDNLQGGDDNDGLSSIGVLDIAGFEIFKQNSFEQLCINYTNEKLQQFFNHHSFILEQSEYLREDIQWEFIDFGLDLQPTIDLIESRNPMGLLQCLDEECVIPNSSDKSFMEKLSQNWGKGQSLKFQENKLKSGFIIHHYAGKVEYNVDNWLQKNTDPVSEAVLSLMLDSSNPFIKKLLKKNDLPTEESPRKSRKAKTTSIKHKEQLSTLMEQLESTEPHFVRCILPNLDKKPNKLDKALVLHQLRCNGVLEGIRITRAGYPNRMTFEEFYLRYSIINVKEVFTKNMRTNSELLLKYIDLDVDNYKVGITKIFFKNGVLGKLEELRDLLLKSIFTELQSMIRGNIARTSIRSKIEEIQSSQVIAKTFSKVEKAMTSNLWMNLFINLKPLLEESVKVLDSQEMNEKLKCMDDKLKDMEDLKKKLDLENDGLRKQMALLEDEIISTSNNMKLKDSQLKQLQANEEENGKWKDKLAIEAEKLGNLESLYKKEKMEYESKLETVKMESELKSKEFEPLKEHIEELNTTISSLEKKLSEMKSQLDDAVASKSTLETQLEDSKINLEKEVSSHVQLIDELKKELHNRQLNDDRSIALNNEVEQLKLTIVKLNEDHSKKVKDISSSLIIGKNYEDEILKLKKEIVQNKATQVKREEELRDTSQKYTTLLSERDNLHRSLSDLNKNFEEMEQLKISLRERERLIKVKDEELLSLKKEIKQSVLENDKLKNDFKKFKANSELTEMKISEYSEKIVSLKNSLETLEREAKEKDLEKENVPPNSSLMDDFANIKLKLNESTASLRKERFENRKLTEEVGMLKTRLNSERTKNSVHPNRRSLAIGEDISLKSDIINEEIESLKIKLQQEEANSQRAEKYAIELQKKVNKLQSTRGLASSIDYEKKYKESQLRIAELEKKFEDFISGDQTPRQLSKSDSFTRSAWSLSNGNQDFVSIYQDITKTLKTTRDELSISKSEILRLKALLRESEDELYEAKRQSFRTSVSNYEDELAELKVKLESLTSKNSELSGVVQLYKNRSEEYYKKLELAESVIKISKRQELNALSELQELKNQLTLAREEARASQILIKETRLQNASLEEKLNDKNYEIEKNMADIRDLKEKISYYTQSYENKERIELMTEEIGNLHKELNFKLEIETKLLKENRTLQLDLEDLTRAKAIVDEDFATSILKVEKLTETSEILTKKNKALEDEVVENERKIGYLTKQINSLKGLVEEISKYRDELLETKDKLDGEIFDLTMKLEDTSAQLKSSESEKTILRKHLEHQKQEFSNLNEDFRNSKLLSQSEMNDYQKLRNNILVTSEENDSLKRVNESLNNKVHLLEEKLYNNEQLKFWESKVNNLIVELDKSHSENHESKKSIQSLERKVKQLEIKAENESQLIKKYNDENFNYQNKENHYKSTIDILHTENLEKELQLKSSQRDNDELRENMLILEKELLELKEKYGHLS